MHGIHVCDSIPRNKNALKYHIKALPNLSLSNSTKWLLPYQYSGIKTVENLVYYKICLNSMYMLNGRRQFLFLISLYNDKENVKVYCQTE